MAWQWWDDFDMRMCGKWRSEEFEYKTSSTTSQMIIFINVEFENNGTGAKVYFDFDKESFSSQAFYVEYSYDSLYFFHNDREFRMEYILSIDENNNDSIRCKLIQRKRDFSKDIIFTRISAPLSGEDIEKYEKFKNKNKVKAKNTSKTDILREYAEYGKEKYDVKFEYKFDERENMLDIIEKNNLDELVKGKSDVETVIALMNWFCARYKHGNPPGGLASTRTPQALMEFADKNEGKTNCRGLSITLAHLIRAYNIKAFHITCMPYEQPFDDCHVVVCAYCDSLKKWIMLDPTDNLYLKNKNGEIIGVDEFRDILIGGEELIFIAGGELLADNHEFISWYRDYMAKNLIRLERGTVARYGCDENDGHIILIPEKYMQNEAKNFDENQQKYFMSSKDDFWQA